MTPLIFIIILTGILVMLIYWILSVPDYRKDRKDITGKSSFFETAKELHNNINNDAKLKQKDILKLSKNHHSININWNICQDTWEKQLKKYSGDINNNDIFIRVHDAHLNFFEIPANTTTGTYNFAHKPDTDYYAIIGLKKNDDFVPLFLSNSIGN